MEIKEKIEDLFVSYSKLAQSDNKTDEKLTQLANFEINVINDDN